MINFLIITLHINKASDIINRHIHLTFDSGAALAATVFSDNTYG